MLTRRKPRSKVGVSAGARNVRTALPSRRETPRRQSRTDDPSRLAFLRSDACGVALACRTTANCRGPIEVEHERHGVGMSQRADDSRTWSCCRKHHAELHSMTGFFRDADRDYIRRFRDERIAISTERYMQHRKAGGAPW